MPGPEVIFRVLPEQVRALLVRESLMNCGIVAVITGLVVVLAGGAWALVIEVVGCGVILILAVELVRQRYLRRSRDSGDLQMIQGSFIDEKTGHELEVSFNPESEEPDYVDRGPPHPGSS